MTSCIATFRPTALSSPPVNSYVAEATRLGPHCRRFEFCAPRRTSAHFLGIFDPRIAPCASIWGPSSGGAEGSPICRGTRDGMAVDAGCPLENPLPV